MAASRRNNGWVIWLTFAIGLLLSVSPMPQFMEVFRPMWLALLVSFWTLAVPSKVGMTTAFVLGLAEDVLYGTLLGQNALILTLITFLVLSLQQRLRIFPRRHPRRLGVQVDNILRIRAVTLPLGNLLRRHAVHQKPLRFADAQRQQIIHKTVARLLQELAAHVIRVHKQVIGRQAFE